ncbi:MULTISPECIES: motility associated factor glycosyltransferase family protein [Uliginosibacterium]|uniref:Motility associated factor glycosyltransferase family protein n=1 Tax=Uliginosibacterium aquaticum TaxID=2731212 RepID=A0ABX2IEX7_9RHOO|nr:MULTISPECIES: 6-hydroxymethylpterin diphosphokinase MptE-like protein [Uliginosibacterium]MDO6385109.1 DUF115 domain-containing protein [Uliginosibacterium sp. 31-12]NSL55176.1 motility associated factor glycosyltransferase family protein [Uliginosibacterium aquaticum]
MDDSSQGALDQEWTPLQEAYIQKLMATYQANLLFFHERFPDVFENIMGAELPAPFEVDADGGLTIYSAGYKGDPKDYVDLSRILMDVFNNPKIRPRITVNHGYINNLHDVAPHQDYSFFHSYIEVEYRTKLVQKFLDLTSEEGRRLPLADFGDKKLPIAIVFGSGFGWHLDRLVDDYDLRHLLIVDTDIARLNLSLYFVDYISLAQRFSRKGFYFSVAYDESPEKLSDHLRVHFYNLWPPYCIQGAGMFFNDYDSEKVRELWDKLKTDLWTFYRGWGFLDDEILGLKHALDNCLARYPAYTRAPERPIPEDAMAFIIGAGPSLDHLLPLLREYRDRAVVFSCGTAISALARAGIRPDFHVEIERTALTNRFLAATLNESWKGEVPILGLSILPPEVFELTQHPLMFFKEMDVGAMVGNFFGEAPVFRSGPTCTNGGLALALRLGFRNIYLMGVDLGFRSEAHHHSKASVYFEGQSTVSPDLKKIVDITHKRHREANAREVEGNFGGKVFSTDTFTHSRDSMVISLRENPGAKVYNLNDGALIRGAEPLHAEDFTSAATPATRMEAIEAMLGAFTTSYDQDPLHSLAMMQEQLVAVREDVARILAPEVHEKMDIVERMFDLHHYFFADKHRSTQIFPLMRGSMLHMGRFLYDCMALCATDELAVEYATEAFGVIQNFLAAASDGLQDLADAARARQASDQGEQQ